MIAGFPGDGGCRETGTASKKKLVSLQGGCPAAFTKNIHAV